MFNKKNFIIVLFVFFTSFTSFSYAETLNFGASTYEGDVKKGKAHGVGIFTFSDGSKYEGKFKKNKFHGKGKYTDADGNIYEGKWRHGKFRNKIDKKTREIINLTFSIGKSSWFEIRGEGRVTNQWFEAEKSSSGAFELTKKGKKDMEGAIQAAQSDGGDGGGGDGGGGGGC
mgnify:FL=1